MADNAEGTGNSRLENPAGGGASPPVAPEPWHPKANIWVIGVVVAMAAFMEVLDTSIANVALPYMAGNLGASNDESTWVLTSYLVSNAIVLAHQRMVRRSDWAQAILHDVPRDLHGEFPALRDCAQPRSDDSVSRDSRRGRRRLATHGAGHSGGHFSAATARRGFRALWHHHHRRSNGRADIGRLDYRQLFLAMDFLHQPAGGHR